MTTKQSHLVPETDGVRCGPMPALEKTNKHEVHCGMCGKVFCVDQDTFEFLTDAINAGLDDPFRCEHCKEEYDDLAYEG